MDEVFGEDNFVAQIFVQKTCTVLGGSIFTALWTIFCGTRRTELALKYRRLFMPAAGSSENAVQHTSSVPDGTHSTAVDRTRLPAGLDDQVRITTRFQPSQAHVAVGGDGSRFLARVQGQEFHAATTGCWNDEPRGLERLAKQADRIDRELRRTSIATSSTTIPFANYQTSGWIPIWRHSADDKIYVVQTNTESHSTLHPDGHRSGRPVLDPTCGSGTTAYVAEQWGRRWITIDTSASRWRWRAPASWARAIHITCSPIQRRPAEGSRNHAMPRLVAASPRRHPPRLCLRARAAHHAQVHRQ